MDYKLYLDKYKNVSRYMRIRLINYINVALRGLLYESSYLVTGIKLIIGWVNSLNYIKAGAM